MESMDWYNVHPRFVNKLNLARWRIIIIRGLGYVGIGINLQLFYQVVIVMRAELEAQRRVDAYECLNRSVVDKQNGCLGDCALVLLCYTRYQPSRFVHPIKSNITTAASSYFYLPSLTLFLDIMEETYNKDLPLSLHQNKSPFRSMCCLLSGLDQSAY